MPIGAPECSDCGLVFNYGTGAEPAKASAEYLEELRPVVDRVSVKGRWFLLAMHALIAAATIQQKPGQPIDVAAWTTVHWLLLLWLPMALIRLTRWSRRVSGTECALVGAAGGVFGLCMLLAGKANHMLGALGLGAYPLFIFILVLAWGDGPPRPTTARNTFVLGLVVALPLAAYGLAVVLGCAGVVSCHGLL